MSRDEDTKAKAGGGSSCCSNCGVAEIDDVKLKNCDKCDLARYCGDECQENHLEKHEAICKERAVELRDEILFKQPESSHWGDCPICFLPLPIDADKNTMYSCCCKFICTGCDYANKIRELNERLKRKCPFCRKPLPKTDEECDKNHEKRAEANDPVALREMGVVQHKEGDYDSAFECFTRAAELHDVRARINLAMMYRKGQGVEKDEKMEIYHLEEAAIAGMPVARKILGAHEWNNKRYDRAVKHWIIAANLGHDDSLQMLKEGYKYYGIVSEDDLAAALRAHHAAVSAMKSPQREAAAAAEQNS